MKIYALRDRMLMYYLQPFSGEGDKVVLASLARTINEKGGTHAIQVSPHHFELWRLANINEETGQVTEDREFLADCAGLVRGDLWEEHNGGTRAPPAAPQSRNGAATRAGDPAHTHDRAVPGTEAPAPLQAP